MTPPPTGPIFTMALTLSNGQTLQDAFVAKSTLGVEKAQIIAHEYRRFLHLAATVPGPTVPSKVLDFMWHLHLEDTRAYQALCDAAFGRFVHHTPGRAPQAQDPAYAQTLERYEQVFGIQADRRVWPRPADYVRSKRNGQAMLLGAGLAVCGGFAGHAGFGALAAALMVIGFSIVLLALVFAATTPHWRINGQSDGGCGGSTNLGSSDGGCGGD